MSPLSDEVARERAATVMDRNLVVTAGAGTGKTTLLVDRITHLLFRQPDPVPIGGIVALTFTNKAANEMKVRLHDRLRLWLSLDPTRESSGRGASREREQLSKIRSTYGVSLAQLRELAKPALHDLEKSQVGTIHSFAAHVLRLYPYEGGVDPEFIEDEGSRFAEHVEREWRLWLDRELGSDGPAHAAWREALAAVSLNDIRELAERLCRDLVPLDVVGECVAWERNGDAPPEAVRRWAASLRDRGLSLRAAHPKTHTLERMLDAATATLARWASDGALGDEARTLSPDLDRDVPGKTTTWTKEEYAAAKTVIGTAKRLSAATLVPLAPLMERLLDFARVCRRRFVEGGAVSFDGLLARARDLLRDHPHVRGALQRQYQAILVDEFQDTDPVQYELVLYLAEAPGQTAARWQDVRLQPGKLFVVGDPKQSIYAFRRADMEAYDRVIDGVVLAGGASGESHVLQTNFRSHAGLLGPVNACFNRLFPSESIKGLQPRNEALIPVSVSAPVESDEGVCVRLVRPAAAEADTEIATRCEAESLARWLADEVLGRQTLREGEAPVAVQPRHVALLLRTLTASRDYVEALRRYGIPYVTEGEKHFFARQEVIDAGNLLRACLLPHDELSLAAVLRSPVGGLTDRELHALVAAGRLDFRRDPPVALRSAQRCYRVLRELHEALPRLPVAAGVDRLFEAAPLLELAAASLDGEQAVANLRKLRLLLIKAADQPGVTWRAVLHRLQLWIEDRPDEAESPLSEEGTESLDPTGAVRVLSIHKAKGLEFPMVILAGLHKGTDKREDRIAVYQDWASGLVGVQVGDYRTVGGLYAAAKLAERQRAEERRILYVAMTRAKRRLILSAGLPSGRGARSDHGLALIGEGWGLDLTEIASGSIEIGETRVRVDVVEGDDVPLTRLGHEETWSAEATIGGSLIERWDRRAARWAAAQTAPRYLTATGLAQRLRPPTQGASARIGSSQSGGIQLGTLVHRVLERWDFSKGLEQLEALGIEVDDLVTDDRQRRRDPLEEAAVAAAEFDHAELRLPRRVPPHRRLQPARGIAPRQMCGRRRAVVVPVPVSRAWRHRAFRIRSRAGTGS